MSLNSIPIQFTEGTDTHNSFQLNSPQQWANSNSIQILWQNSWIQLFWILFWGIELELIREFESSRTGLVISSFDSVRSNRLWVINNFIRTFQKSSGTPLDGKMDNSYKSNSFSGCYLPCLIIKWVVIIWCFNVQRLNVLFW